MTDVTDVQIWSSLPVPAILIDDDERIADLNPAAEGFLNNSAKWLTGQPIWDRLAVDAPLEESLARARAPGIECQHLGAHGICRCRGVCARPDRKLEIAQ